MEKVTYLKNGQWKLEKADMKAKDSSKLRNWMHGGLREHLKDIPELEGRQRQKALSDIGKDAVSRVNLETGEKEYRLFRASSAKKPIWEDNLSSWTTNHAMGHYWGALSSGQYYNPEDGMNPDPEWANSDVVVHHAWIPEKHIHSNTTTVAGTEHERASEKEVLVKPHKVNIFHSEQPSRPDTEDYKPLKD